MGSGHPTSARSRLHGLCLYNAMKIMLTCAIPTTYNNEGFSVMGVSLFKGRFQYCTDHAVLAPENCTGNYTEMLEFNRTAESPRLWQTQYLNFDSVYKAAEALVSIIGFERWQKLYFNSADSNANMELGPVLNQRSGVILFYLAYVLFVSLFFINVVMAFVVLTYRKQSDQKYQATGMTSYQAKCLHVALHLPKPRDPHHHRRGIALLDFADSNTLDYFMLFVSSTDMVVQLMYHEKATDHFTARLNQANIAFLAIYGAEFLLKFVMFGPKSYLNTKWNWFNVIMLIGGGVDAAMNGGGSTATFAGLTIFRAARVFKVFNSNPLRQMFTEIMDSLSAVGWVMLLMLLFYYIYAVIGMLLFARIPFPDPNSDDAYAFPINFRNNFRTLPAALMLLFRTMSGEDWQLLMEGSYIQDQTRCNSADPLGSTCGSTVNSFYFISFTLITFLLVLNVMMAVIMDNFETIQIDDSELQMQHIAEFVAEWRMRDPTGKGRIKRLDLLSLLKSIPPPLGLGIHCPTLVAHQFLAKLHVPLSENDEVSFRAALVGIIRTRLDLWLFDFKDHNDIKNLFRYVAPHAPEEHLEEASPKEQELKTLRMFYTVVRLQTIFRQRNNQNFSSSIDIGMPAARGGGAAVLQAKKMQQKKASIAKKSEAKQNASMKKAKEKGKGKGKRKVVGGSSSESSPKLGDEDEVGFGFGRSPSELYHGSTGVSNPAYKVEEERAAADDDDDDNEPNSNVGTHDEITTLPPNVPRPSTVDGGIENKHSSIDAENDANEEETDFGFPE